MRGRVGMMVGVVSLFSAGALFAQQPQAKSSATPAAATQPAAQQPGQQPAPKAKTSKAKVAASKWTKEQVTAAQEGLKRAKMYNGPTNGVLGRATTRAIRAFQREHKLTVNGQLSDSLLDMLKAIPQ